ncbi:helix-turn-helix domain-containing protein [Metabacillus sp. KIGAM252]|uniref:Helix-turn-helix domain-containing protein n=1 Tax=Metabacillus flavus TaxID=2823519 RepID=A0ABS5LEC2_9BACI|nr:RodZ domain-containing protein [Metabacillus flavus]MBS2969056.1 helix-turn-helix domain-containing protein [Metabacillus flavus]
MSELGNRLKQAREEKQLTLDDLQTMTKIQKRYLVGIEEGNYKIMPGQFYVRAFIKQYAEAVGLDPDQLFEEYKKDVPDSGQDELPGQLSRVQTQRELPESASKAIDLLPKILIILLIVAAAVVIWMVNQNNSGSEKAAKPKSESESISSEVKMDESLKNKETSEKAEEKPEPQPEPAKIEPPAPKQAISGKSTGTASSTYAVSGAEKLEIEISAKGSTWIGVKNSKGKSFFSGVLNSGKMQKIDASNENEVKIRIGNMPNTDIKVNGEPLKYVIDPSKKMTQSITITYTKAEKSSS